MNTDDEKLLVMFFSNGNTAVFFDSKQQTELQQPWILLFAEFLESKGIDPLKCKFVIQPSGEIVGSVVRFYRTAEGMNWRISEH